MNIKDALINYLKQKPSSFTYIGIGSAPVDITKLNVFTDQILPKFIIDKNKNVDTFRIIHFDPAFSKISKALFNEYFISKDLGLFHYPQDGILTWVNSNNSIEINIISEPFVHGEDDYFLENVIDICLLYESQLIVQEYTGYNLYNLFMSLYKKNEDKELFKKKILFDVSYDQDCHCFIDLQKHFPLYDKNNDFLNILLFSYDEFLSSIGLDKNIDNIIKFHFIEKLKKIEKEYIPDFRRKLLKMEIQNCLEYDKECTPLDILNVIKKNVDDIFRVLEKLKIVKVNEYIYNNVFINYTKYNDPYKWFDDYRKCYDII